MLRYVIEKLSNYPSLFLFCRGLLEADFREIRRTIREYLPDSNNQRVLDIACGPGAFSELFTADVYVGVDINRRYIEYAQRQYKGTFHVMDARHVEFSEDSFDGVLVLGLLHHLNDDDALEVLKGVARVLKPSGRVLIIEDIPSESRLNVVGHLLHRIENGHFIRSAEEYRTLLGAYLKKQSEQVFRSGFCDYYMAVLTCNDNSDDV